MRSVLGFSMPQSWMLVSRRQVKAALSEADPNSTQLCSCGHTYPSSVLFLLAACA